MSDKVIYIYALVNPFDDSVFYVGATMYPTLRLTNHLSLSKVNASYKSTQIKNIAARGGKVEMLILEECGQKEVRFLEEFYIELFIFYGFKLEQEKKSTYKDEDICSHVNNKATVFRLSTEILTTLKAEAAKADRSLHWYILNILRQYVKTLPE